MTKVLHLISSADRRGAQVFATQLAGELGGSPEHTVVAISPATTPNPLPVAVLGTRRWDPSGFLRLVAGLRRHDLLIAHGSSALLHGALASRAASTPFVYRNIGDPSAWGAVRAADLRIGGPLRRARAVSALYPAARDHLVRAYRLEPARVWTIPNGVPSFDRPGESSQASERAELGLDPTLDWVAFVGSLSEEKGILDAVRAIALDPRLGLVVAGDGPQRAQAIQLAERLARDRVRFVGVTDAPLSILAAADVLVLPSRTEGLPAAAIEAGLSGLPVVATDVGGLSEIVGDDATGVLVPDTRPETLARGLRRALDRRDELGAAARRRCEERFTLERTAARWAELIAQVTGR